MRTDKVIVEIDLQERETAEEWLKNNLGSVKFSRIRSVKAVVEEPRKVTGKQKQQS